MCRDGTILILKYLNNFCFTKVRSKLCVAQHGLLFPGFILFRSGLEATHREYMGREDHLELNRILILLYEVYKVIAMNVLLIFQQSGASKSHPELHY